MRPFELTLELSLKPFKAEIDEETVITELLLQYADLIRASSNLSFQFWTSDGSEILSYSGDIDSSFEWACYIGNANATGAVPNDPLCLDPHSRSYLYSGTPRIWTYSSLAKLISKIKLICKNKGLGNVLIGATFDPGPEFAISEWKYKRHPEACEGSKAMGKDRFVMCSSTLHADKFTYAGFPEGIPEGTSFGTFFGKQSLHFCRDLGFDFLWLSNGFGCGTETWTTTGPGFDGKVFSYDSAESSGKRALGFWRDFRKEASATQLPVRLRGTNLTTGIDLASDGAPWRALFSAGDHGGDESLGVSSPPNSPWAALDGNFGLELSGWMSHVAALPSNGTFLFRFYANDPWWKNSPWLDRYGGQPHDIYLPLAVSRITGTGEIQPPNRVSLLTVDDSFGAFPPRVARGLIPPLLNSLEQAPDDLPPTVWIYPFDEYHDFVESKTRTNEAFANDWLIAAAINEGFPLNAVISTRNYLSTIQLSPDRFKNVVLVTRVPDDGSTLSEQLIAHILNGGKVLFYGPVFNAGAKMLNLFKVDLAPPLEGDFILNCSRSSKLDEGGIEPPTTIRHRPEINAGGLEAVASTNESTGYQVLALATESTTSGNSSPQSRICLLSRTESEWKGGALSWVRGTYCASFRGGHLLTPDDPSCYARGERLMRVALSELGWEVSVIRHSPPIEHVREVNVNATEEVAPETVPWELIQLEAARKQDAHVIGLHSHDGALWFSAFSRDTTSKIRLRFQGGAPLLIGSEAWVSRGRAEYNLPRAIRQECRALVEQETESIVSVVEGTAEQMGISRRVWLRGLRSANVTLLLPKGCTPILLVNPLWPFISGTSPQTSLDSLGRIKCERVTGALCINW